MEALVTTIHIGTCVLLILLVLIQSGKGAEAGASLGAGGSQTVFGSSGGANFFTKLTAFFATVFMITSISLTYFGAKGKSDLMKGEYSMPSTTTKPDAKGTAGAGKESAKNEAPKTDASKPETKK